MFASVLAAGLALGVTVEAPAAPAAGGEAEAVAESPSFEGTFRFAGGKRQRTGVDEAIERAVEALPVVFHGLARKRLKRANTVPGRVTMTMKGDELEIAYGDLTPWRAPLDGSVRKWTNREGTPVNLTMKRKGNRLVQTTWSDTGRRVMVWTLSDEGRLRMHSTMSSPRLPVAIDYRLTFRE